MKCPKSKNHENRASFFNLNVFCIVRSTIPYDPCWYACSSICLCRFLHPIPYNFWQYIPRKSGMIFVNSKSKPIYSKVFNTRVHFYTIKSHLNIKLTCFAQSNEHAPINHKMLKIQE